MAVSTKRKHAALDEPQKSKKAKQQTPQPSIKAFSRVSKRQLHDNLKAKKAIEQFDVASPVQPVSSAPLEKTSNRKRKLRDGTEDRGEKDDHCRSSSQAETELHITTPRSKRTRHMPSSPIGTPSSKTAALFSRLGLDTARDLPKLNLTKTIPDHSYHTPPDSPGTERDTSVTTLPSEVRALQDLHSCFLAALQIYYVHNGASSPVKIQELLPMISTQWRKREVTLEDLRRILAVYNEADLLFRLENNPRNGIVLIKLPARGRSTNRLASHLDVDQLNGQFEMTLKQSWKNWSFASTVTQTAKSSAFIAQLPLIDIVQPSMEKLAPLFVRGQQRRADLLADSAANTKTHQPNPSLPPQTESNPAHPPSIPAPQSRGTALLDRILAKQSAAASLPAGPTPAARARAAALQRVGDVARVLALVSGSQQNPQRGSQPRTRATFPLPALTQQIQQSVRVALARDEIVRCLELLAAELAPGFVRVVRSGEVTCVVVVPGAAPSAEELRAKVDAAAKVDG